MIIVTVLMAVMSQEQVHVQMAASTVPMLVINLKFYHRTGNLKCIHLLEPLF